MRWVEKNVNKGDRRGRRAVGEIRILGEGRGTRM